MTHPLRPRMRESSYGGSHAWYYRRAREMVHNASSEDSSEEFSTVHWPRLHRELMRLWSAQILDTQRRAEPHSEAAAVEDETEDEVHDYESDAEEPHEYDLVEDPDSPPLQKWQRDVRGHLGIASSALEECAGQMQEGPYLELYNALQSIYNLTR